MGIMISFIYRNNFLWLVAKILFQYYSVSLFNAWILLCSWSELCSGDAEVFLLLPPSPLHFICFGIVLSVQAPLLLLAIWLYPKVKTEGCATVFHSKDCLCLGRECSVNWQCTGIVIIAMLIKNQELHQLNKGKGKPADELNVFLYLLLECEDGSSILNKSCVLSCGNTKLLC